MATKTIVTQEAVFKAAAELAKGNQRPSVRNVIRAIGGGSPNDVAPLLAQWKETHTIAAAPVVIDPRLVQVLSEQIAVAVATAREEAAADLAALQEDAAELARAGSEAEALASELGQSLEKIRDELQQQIGRNASLQSEVDAMKAQTEVDVREANARALREREAAETARQALARAILQLEDMPRLQAELDALRAELASVREANVKSEKASAAAQAQSDKLAAVAQAQRDAAEARAHAADEARERVDAEARDAAARAREAAARAHDEQAELRRALDASAAQIQELLRERIALVLPSTPTP